MVEDCVQPGQGAKKNLSVVLVVPQESKTIQGLLLDFGFLVLRFGILSGTNLMEVEI